MRHSQQNRRSRGRNNNNNNSGRKGQNPLTRSFESNGPDVKIRGTPSHIAEKYVTMARDALSSGDPVLAENYLQHAEHYNRIIMTYREQQGDQSNTGNAAIGRHRNPGDPVDDAGSNEDSNTGAEQNSDGGRPRGTEPQPRIRNGDREERPSRRGSQRRDRNNDRSRTPEREASSDEERAPAPAPAAEQEPAAAPTKSSSRGGARRSRYAQSDDQPEFLKRPVRRPRSQASDDDDAEKPSAPSDEAAE